MVTSLFAIHSLYLLLTVTGIIKSEFQGQDDESCLYEDDERTF